MVMHEQDDCGQICGTVNDLASDGRCSPGEMRSVISELATHCIADVTERNGIVTLINRRMRREYLARKSNQTRQQRYREKLRTGPDNGDSNGNVAPPAHVRVSNTDSPNPERTEEGSLGEVFLYWQVVFNHPNAKFTDGKKAKIRARFREGFAVEQLKTAVDGCKCSEYHMGGNTNGTVYDSIDLIFRNAEKVEQFIGYFNRSLEPKRTLNERRVIDSASQLIEEIKRDACGTSYAH